MNDVSRNKVGTISKDFKKLGFKSDSNPVLDFEETPPGMLALDCMHYFAKYHVEAYTKVSCLDVVDKNLITSDQEWVFRLF